MTTIARETGAQGGHAPQAAAGGCAGAGEVLSLAWDVPSGAAGMAGPATVEIVLEGDAARGRVAARARVRAGDRLVELARDVPVAVAFDSAAGVWHADAPGLMAATWRTEAEGVRVLYARTRIIERLGVRGGTYELRSAGPR